VAQGAATRSSVCELTYQHGGDFREDVKDSMGKMKHEQGKRSDRDHEVETDSGFNGDRSGDWRRAAS